MGKVSRKQRDTSFDLVKNDVIGLVSRSGEITKDKADLVVNSVLDAIKSTVARGGSGRLKGRVAG